MYVCGSNGNIHIGLVVGKLHSWRRPRLTKLVSTNPRDRPGITQVHQKKMPLRYSGSSHQNVRILKEKVSPQTLLLNGEELGRVSGGVFVKPPIEQAGVLYPFQLPLPPELLFVEMNDERSEGMRIGQGL